MASVGSSAATGRRGDGPVRGRGRWRRLSVGLLALAAAACNPGAYPVDLFPEMHYQASQRRLEPRRLAAPDEAVPVTGARPKLTFEQAGRLQNPVARGPESIERARQVYRVNCATCHGSNGDGQSTIAGYFRAAGVMPPVDFASDRVRGRTDGELYWIVANGLGNMPPFGSLLTEEELWTVVHFIRGVQER